MAFDATRIVDQMNIKGSLPSGRFEDQELLDFAYDSLLSELVPAVLLARENFFVTTADYTITADQAAYVLPGRALNGIIREVKLVDGTTVTDLARMDVEDVTTTVTGTPHSFYVLGSSIYLYPTPSTTTGTLRVYYPIRPSRLVEVTACGRITAINGLVVSLTIPTGWTTTNTFDLVRGRAHFDILSTDLTASSVAGGSITLSAVPTTLAVGDYICLAEESCFPLLPPEGHVALVQCAVAAALESMGDPTSGVAATKAAKLRDDFVNVLKTRVQGAPKPLGKPLLF